MQSKLFMATVLTVTGIVFTGTAYAEGAAENDAGEAAQYRMFLAANVNLERASQIALTEVPGALAEIGFNDVDGRGVYEALVVSADGQASIVLIDANSGDVLGAGLASAMSDEENNNGECGDDNAD